VNYSYIAIEGLIGAGKTTLARRLAERWGARLVLEEFDDNPFLPRFYEDPERFAFAVELSFLAQRYHQLKRVTEQDLFAPRTVADYSIGKSLVFATATLGAEENALFSDLYRIMYADLPRPELIVYLHLGPARAQERIRARGRSYEQGIQAAYLERLRDLYFDQMRKAEGSRVLIVDLGDRDLLHDAAAFSQLCDRLEKPMEASFEVLQL